MVGSLIIAGLSMTGGLAGFITYLVLFIQSYQVETGEWGTEVSSNQDYMVLFFLFLMLALCGVSLLFTTLKKKKSNVMVFSLAVAITGVVSFIYGLARLIKAYSKNKPVADYWIWVIFSAVVIAAFLTFYFLLRKAKSLEAVSEPLPEEGPTSEEENPETEPEKE